MKNILFALAVSFGISQVGNAWACDCEHKKSEKACKGNCNPENCGGSCNGKKQEHEKPEAAKESKKESKK